MSAAIYTRTIRARGVGAIVAALSVGLLLVLGMAVYADIDLSVYTDLPEAMRALMGIPDGADAAALSYNVMLGTIGSLTMAGLALSYGASAIAGEERDGTLGLLLGNPASRTRVVVSKAVALITLTTATGLLVWGAGMLAPAILGVETGTTAVGAMALHLTVNALFYGLLAMAIGAWTGNRSLASAATAGFMVLSFVLVGILPLVEATAGLVEVLPWDWFNGSQPLLNGVDIGDLALLAGGIAVFAGAAVVGVRRRDLRGRTVRTTLVDRLREHPMTRQVADRIAGSARVSRIAVKTASEHQGLLLVVALVMFAMMGLMMGPMYAAMEGNLADLTDSLPQDFLAIAGGGDMSTPEGYYQTESLGLMAPIAVILVGTAIAARALAGEERNRTIGLLLASPISRSRIVAEKAATMVVFVVVVGLATFAGIAGGSVLGGLGMDIGNIAATAVLLTLVGLVFSGLALAVGAATGRVGPAIYATVGAALALHLVHAFLSISDRLADWAMVSPFYYYSSSQPLTNGLPWGHAAVLAALAAALVGLAFPLFQRRDLRHG